MSYQVPDRHLLAPVGSVARYQTLEWLNYVATELHKVKRWPVSHCLSASEASTYCSFFSSNARATGL
jgi:hypothetical protein